MFFFFLFYYLIFKEEDLMLIMTRVLKILTGSRPKDLIKGLGGCSFLHFNLAIPSVPLHDANAAPKTDIPLNILPPVAKRFIKYHTCM